MPYQVSYTENTNSSKPAITVADQTLNTQTNLTFVGKNYAGYAPYLANDLLHLLENFAAPQAPGASNSAIPGTPVQGQLWFDNSPGVNLLKVFDGTTWSAAGSVKKSQTAPAVANSTVGDLWADTTNKQLYVFSGSNWILVGPQFSGGTNSGPQTETLYDNANGAHNVISLYSNNNRIAVISDSAFTPKTTISGFNSINQGITLNATNASSTTAPTKFWGTSSAADSLNVNGSAILASNFLRGDTTSITSFPIKIQSDDGVFIGSDGTLSITNPIGNNVAVTLTSGKGIDFSLNATLGGQSEGQTTVLHIDSKTRVGIGQNNLNPTATLDIIGNVQSTGPLLVEDTTTSSAIGIGSIVTLGGISTGVGKQSRFGGNIVINATQPNASNGGILINNLSNGDSGTELGGAVILPGTDGGAHKYDIGTVARPFRTIYADTFYSTGTISGSFTGTLTGNITGSAAVLASATQFQITGDLITVGTVPFNGATETGYLTLETVLNPTFITTNADGSARSVASGSLDNDAFLIYRSANTDGTGAGLKQTNKAEFLSNVPLVPIGSIFPFGGSTPPSGYLLCDGSEVSQTIYSALFKVIAFNYGASNTVHSGYFKLPDLRGRFPLGADNMNNNLQVQVGNSSVATGGALGRANNVSDYQSTVLGAHNGNQTQSLTLANLPDHKHTMKSDNGGQYFGVGFNTSSDTSAQGNVVNPGNTGVGLANSGRVDASSLPAGQSLGQSFNVMNPYQTVNYIIYTGHIA